MMAKRSTHRVRLADVAADADVSITTASVILSGRPENLKQFHPDTISKVLRSASRLGYSANLFASGLPSAAAPFFALIIHQVGRRDTADWYLWGFEGDLLGGVVRSAAESGLYPIVERIDPDSGQASLRSVEQIIAGGVSGAIVRSPGPILEKYLRARIRRGQPIVVVFPNRLAGWRSNAIDVDNAAVGETAAMLLALQGRRRWLLLRPRKRVEAQLLRCEGFLRIAKSVNAAVETIEVPWAACESFTSARNYLVRRLEGTSFDGIFGAESAVSIGSLLAELKRGRKPGEDFNLVGCDCAPWHSPPLPQITCVDISWRDVGTTAVRMLTQLASRGQSRFETILMKPRVVAAQTCPAPSDAVIDSSRGSLTL